MRRSAKYLAIGSLACLPLLAGMGDAMYGSRAATSMHPAPRQSGCPEDGSSSAAAGSGMRDIGGAEVHPGIAQRRQPRADAAAPGWNRHAGTANIAA
jgi:hypothetical protein